MKYDIVYSCGHPGVVRVVGPTKDRQYWIDREAEKLCAECQAKQDEETVNELRAQWAEKGYPALSGSTKQILWANQIREREIANATEKFNLLKRRSERHPEKFTPETFEFIANYDKCFHFALQDGTTSSYWIEDGKSLAYTIEDVWKTKKFEIVPDSSIVIRIAEPEDRKTDNTAEIKLFTNEFGTSFVKIISPKDSKIIDVAKSASYFWSSKRSVWADTITEQYASPDDAQAYIAAKLLDAGVPVKADERILQMAITGTYKPKLLRFVFFRKDRFEIEFPYGDSCKDAVRDMGARWEPLLRAYILKPDEWRKIEDLVNLYGFGISESARKHIEDQHNSIVKVSGVVVNEQEQGGGIEAVLQSSREILDDLKDD